MIKRTKIGIENLDKYISNGISEKQSLLLCGKAGTLKTIFGLEFLYKGVTQFKENGVYVTFENDTSSLKNQAEMFNWNLSTLEKQYKLTFVKVPVDKYNYNIIKEITDAIIETKAKRLVIDSLSILAFNARMYWLPIEDVKDNGIEYYDRFNFTKTNNISRYEMQEFIYLFISKIKELGVTTLFIADSSNTEEYLTRDTVSEFACDNVFNLKNKIIGNKIEREIEIIKMRNNEIKYPLLKLEIGKKGLVVNNL